jgi:hypothetical protein
MTKCGYRFTSSALVRHRHGGKQSLAIVVIGFHHELPSPSSGVLHLHQHGIPTLFEWSLEEGEAGFALLPIRAVPLVAQIAVLSMRQLTKYQHSVSSSNAVAT